MFLSAVCACGLALCAEPNESKTELKFEISTRLGSKGLMKFTGPVKPKYVAKFSMSDLSQIGQEFDVHRDYPALTKMILATSVGQSMSEIQKELLKADRVISTSISIVEEQMYNVEKTEFGLYAFTIDDAKNMSRALIEILSKIACEKQPPMLEKFINERKLKLQEHQERIADTKKKLSEKEPELKPAESAYKKLKNTDQYKTLADTEAYEKAKETITQMNKMLSILEIELSGIQEKLVIIEKYRESDKFSKATLEKLEQMFVEQMVELRGVIGRKEAALKLRNQDKQFCDFFDAWTSLESEVKHLRNRLRNDEKRVRFYEEEIANPHPELLPPKVLENKVTIYPL
jgi:chromosome segregation ATPase